MSGAKDNKALPLNTDPAAREKAAHEAHVAFAEAETLNSLWDELVLYAKSLGADLLSYHHHAPDFAPDYENISIRTYGFPEHWVAQYKAERLYRIDPIAQIFAYRVRPVLWSQIKDLIPLTPEQSQYLVRLHEWMRGDGFGFPTFGPGGRHGYIGIGRASRLLDDWDPLTTNRLHWVLECFHLRWCELVLMSLPQDFELTERELNVLKSMAMGMSEEIICGAIGAQLDSVRRSIRDILKKMGVSDRPSAILRGVGAGLLDAENSVLRRV